MKLLSGIVELKPGWFVRLPRPMTEMEMAHWRFDPLTAAIIGGTGLIAAGQIQAGRAAAAEGKSAQNIQNYNAAVAESEAKAIEEKGKFEGIRQVREAARIQSALRARIGVSGVRTDIGAPVLLVEEQAAESELAGFLVGAEARAKAGKARSEATLARLQGQLFRERGRQARAAAFLKAGGTLLTGFGLAGGAAPAGGLPKVGTVTPEAGATFARF